MKKDNLIKDIEQLDVKELTELRNKCVFIAEIVEDKLKEKENKYLFYV